MTLAVTGASGHLGNLVVQHLLARGTDPADIVALVRDPAKAAELTTRGVTARAFDYDQPDVAALLGADSLLLISGTAFGRRFEQHKAVIDAARSAGVSRLVYTSAPHADASINPVAPEHKATEDYLATAGVPYVLLRNGWYHENYLQTLATAAQTGEVLTAAGDGHVASASRSDLAEAAAVVLASEETGRIYELTGDVAWSFDDLAATIGAVLGREITVRKVSGSEEAKILADAGLDAGTAGFVTGVDAAIAAGELGGVNGELSTLIGHPTAPIADSLAAAV